MIRSRFHAGMVLAVLLLAGCGKDIGPVTQIAAPDPGRDVVAPAAGALIDASGDAELFPVEPPDGGVVEDHPSSRRVVADSAGGSALARRHTLHRQRLRWLREHLLAPVVGEVESERQLVEQ